jgi:prepilin peptidase CpaA
MGDPVLWIYIALVSVLLGCAYSDIRARIIPNLLCALVVILGIAEAFVVERPDLLRSVLVALVVFVAMMPFQQKKVLGGGDVKLIAALSVWLAPLEVGRFFLFILLGGGVLGLFYLAKNWIIGLIRREPSPSSSVPYGVAIVCGFLAVHPGPLLEVLFR